MKVLPSHPLSSSCVSIPLPPDPIWSYTDIKTALPVHQKPSNFRSKQVLPVSFYQTALFFICIFLARINSNAKARHAPDTERPWNCQQHCPHHLTAHNKLTLVRQICNDAHFIQLLCSHTDKILNQSPPGSASMRHTWKVDSLACTHTGCSTVSLRTSRDPSWHLKILFLKEKYDHTTVVKW